MRDFGSPYESMTPKILEKYSSYQFEYLSLAQMLNKTHSQRNHNEIRFLAEFIKKNGAFKELL